MKDQYLTILQESLGEYKDRGSKFLAFAYPFDNEAKLGHIIGNLKSIHPKAVHYCYAYQIGLDKNQFRCNDDGEPSGSAGKPIYGQILSYGLTDIIIVVVRYFGGTKLGIPGLIEAYSESAKAALVNSVIGTKYVVRKYQLIFGYEYMGHIMNVIKNNAIHMISKTFTDQCYIFIEIRLSKEIETIHKLKADIMERSLDEIGPNYEISYCTISCVD
jgi:uncharacterized YigZ family protein